MKTLILLLFSLSHTLNASQEPKEQIYCTHAQVCKLANDLLQHTDTIEVMQVTAPQNLNDLNSKNYLKGMYLLAPSELDDFSEKVTFIRESKNLPSLKLYLPTHKTKLYKLNIGALPDSEIAQFWYFPDLTCEAKKILVSEFQRYWKTLKKDAPLNMDHDCQKLLKVQDQIISHLKSHNETIQTNTPFDLLLKRFQVYGEQKIMVDDIFDSNRSAMATFTTLRDRIKGKTP